MRSGLPVGTRLWLGLPVLLALLWVTGMLTVQSVVGLPHPPEFTEWALPILRYTRDLAAFAAVGSVAVGGLLVDGRSKRALRWGSYFALGWLLALTLQFALTLSDVFALAPGEATDAADWWPLLTSNLLGQVFLWQFVAVAVVAATAWAIRGRRVAWAVTALAVAAAAAPGLLGHGGLSSTHVAATASLAIHIGAVSLWIGGLLAVIALVAVTPERAASVLPRFSRLALVCVIVIAETGLLNASLRLSSASQFVTSWYGAFVLGKALLLAALIRLGWLQRRRVLAAQSDIETTPRSLLVRFAGWEFAAMGVAVGVSVAMARVGPSPVTATAAPLNPLAVTLLALALPILLTVVFPRRPGARWLRRLRSYPEMAAVILLIVVVEVAGVAITTTLLGAELGAIVAAPLLVGAGWLFASAVDGPRGYVGIVVAMVGWPLASVAIMALASAGPAPRWQAQLLSVALAEALLVTLLVRTRSGSATTVTPALQPIEQVSAR